MKPIHSFKYDAFQQKAIEAINQNHSVLVSAPTGAGKTAIAEFAIDRALQKNESIIYTAPIKAISNQKFRDFGRRFPGQVGILTGDVSIEPDAPILIMTTEIYRNQLFESRQRREISWVIFDEVHFLDDYERGTVWEEAIMFSEEHTRFVALSATAPNVQEIADWIQSIHDHPITVVVENKRPVKLLHQFHCQNIVLEDLLSLKKKGFLGLNHWSRAQEHRSARRRRRFSKSFKYEKRLRAKPNRIHDLLKSLIQNDQMPCLYFAFGRQRVEILAQDYTHFDLLNDNERKENRTRFNKLLVQYGLQKDPSAIKMGYLVEKGIAYHHAGLLPTLKEIVEQLFTDKRIRLIFTTETFALGINMPARTVVFDELRKFYGFGFEDLTTRDYFQMAGRAGRRGLDKVGYVYSRINPQLIRFDAVQRMIQGKMEPIKSQFNASYATLLNLYKQVGDRLIEIYPQSLHYFQSNQKKHKRAVLNIERKLSLLKQMNYISKGKVTAKGEFASWIYGYELLLSELWEEEFLNTLGPVEICVLLAGLVYEPKKNEKLIPLPDRFRHLGKKCFSLMTSIHHMEEKFHIYPPTKKPYFNLTLAVEAWLSGSNFNQLFHHIDVDEGILIRYFRMVIQLLRQLRTDTGASEKLKKTISQVMPVMNRDIIDAEKLLRSAVENSGEPEKKKTNPDSDTNWESTNPPSTD